MRERQKGVANATIGKVTPIGESGQYYFATAMNGRNTGNSRVNVRTPEQSSDFYSSFRELLICGAVNETSRDIQNLITRDSIHVSNLTPVLCKMTELTIDVFEFTTGDDAWKTEHVRTVVHP